LFKWRLNSSAAAVFLVCLATAWNGAKVLEYLRAADHLDRLSGASDSSRKVIAGELRSFIANWNDVTGVADAARRLSDGVVRDAMPDDKAAIENAVAEIVANSPTTYTVWQNLAELRYARGAPIESVLAAFRMSDLTGSHEGYTMVERAMFGLEHWADLTQADRGIVVKDLAGTLDPAFNLQQQRYREILAAKPESERADIFARLKASGFGTPDVLHALGD
jgi:hypothetical protein